MPRPVFTPLVLAALALAPLHAQQAPKAEPAPSAVTPAPVDLAELKPLASAKDTATLLKLVKAAQELAPGIADPAERALTLGTLSEISAKPSAAREILAAHAARLTEIRNRTPETIFLTRVAGAKSAEEVKRIARETYADADKLGDVFLRRTVRFTLAKLEDKPGEAPAILKAHLKTVGDRFQSAALASFEANDAKGAFDSVHIALRCDPENIKARFLLAHMLHSSLGETDKAVVVLREGLEHLSPASPETGAYLDRYFQLLEARENDAEVVAQTSTLLSKDGFPADSREMMAMHLATCLYFTGRNEEASSVIAKHGLGKRVQGKLLEARCLFDSRRTEAATRALESAAPDFKGAERDAVLGQLQRFWTDLGKNDLAISVTDQRIREFPERPSPHVHLLWIYDRIGDTTRFGNELRSVFARFSENQGAMLGVANLAAERGMSGLAADCFRRARTFNFNRPLFGLLVLEAHINAKEYREAIRTHADLLAQDKTIFKGDAATVHALLAAAKTGLGDPVSKSEAERHIKAFLDSKNLRPESYMSSAHLIRRAGDAHTAQKILEAGRRAHPWNNQLRADLAAVRILTGQTEAYGTRPALVDELPAIAKGRRVNPRLWDAVGTWLQTEAKLTPEKLRELRTLAGSNARPDLVKDSVRE